MKKLTSWLDIPADSDFSIYNLPFGIFSKKKGKTRAGIAIGNHIVDLAALAEAELIDVSPFVFRQSTLNEFIGLGKEVTNKVRLDVQGLLIDADSPLKKKPEILVPQADVQMHLPVHIGDYTDFYSSIEHATNVGKMFRDPENALLPNWRHIPVGYHGRASSIVVSGTPIKRPKGQLMPKDATAPVFKPSGRLDFELEMGFITGKNTQLGTSIGTKEAEDYIFGLVLFNDWSARDIQKWEYVPLGPFLGKNFGSSISPWIVTIEALEPFKVAGPKQDPEVLPYLKYEGNQNYDVQLEVALQPENGEEQTVSSSNFKYMYWNMAQQLAHHTINGCNIHIGDVMASGTISGKDESSYGSMLEISWGGSKPITLKDGSTRTFIEDNDTVIMRGFAEKDGIKVGFGEVRGTILPAD
ncbi:fumarylacetoacetase [Maribacter chungangensis]|uniref:fumarylacetoacetase n=1 Tax=Maribacter chungangensis TaxID=1069117 RepID=A0ABW3B5X2_9FLAO